LKGILVVSNNCQPCHNMKDKYAEQIKNGEIDVVSLEDNADKVKDLMEKYNIEITSIPELLIVAENGDAIAIS